MFVSSEVYMESILWILVVSNMSTDDEAEKSILISLGFVGWF